VLVIRSEAAESGGLSAAPSALGTGPAPESA
jgi:hypothetical protein